MSWSSDLAGLRCVVFGGGGFIGTNLCRSLAGQVASLRAFGRRKAFPDALDGISWIQGDFSDPSALASAVEGCDVAFHLVNASTPSSANLDKLADVQSNLVPSLHLLEVCREAGVRRIVFVSSGGTVYGVDAAVPTPETAPPWPITAYGISKLAIERYLHLYEYLNGIEYRVLRVSNPFGPFQSAAKNQGVVAAFMKAMIDGRPLEIWGDGTVERDYVYVSDVVEALERAAVHQGGERVFNIGSGRARSLNAVVDALSSIAGRTLDVRYRQGRKVDVPVSMLDVALAERALDWRPETRFEEGLRLMRDWMGGATG